MRRVWDIWGILLLVVLGFLFIAFLIATVQVAERENYEIGRYTDTEVIQIFETSENDFLRIAKIVSETSDFWESKRAFDNPHAYINSPNNDNKLKCFRKEDRETLIAFFRTWKPVIVSYDNQMGSNCFCKRGRFRFLYLRLFDGGKSGRRDASGISFVSESERMPERGGTRDAVVFFG